MEFQNNTPLYPQTRPGFRRLENYPRIQLKFNAINFNFNKAYLGGRKVH